MVKIKLNKCPNCGADLTFDENGHARCDYCGSEFDNDEQQIQKKAYKEESGRLKAQREHQQKMYEQQKMQEEEERRREEQRALEEKKKNRGCLWWCGTVFLWLCFFPIMFTIYIVKNDKLDTKKKIIILAVAWVIFLILGFSQQGNQTGNSNPGSQTINDQDNYQQEPEAGTVTSSQIQTETGSQETVSTEESKAAGDASQETSVKAEASTSEQEDSSVSSGEASALAMAKLHLETLAFSKKGLKDQLLFEGFSEEEAAYAVDHCEADWKEQAVKKAEEYKALMDLSAGYLREQLAYEGFEEEEIDYAIGQLGL